MAKVGIVMGSDSDMPVMRKAAEILEKLGIDFEMKIISAHREPDVFFEYAKTAEEKGFKVIIAGAGMAAHLPGMCAAIFPMPVIGIPMHTTSLGGRDYPCCHGSYQRRGECRPFGSEDPCYFRSGASDPAEGIQPGVKRAGGSERREIAGSRI